MGWDHHHAASTKPFFPPRLSPPSLSSVEIRQDLNSIADLFTMRGLVESFDLEAINHKRAAVFLPKLDWINKMHLRRAGMVSRGEEREEEGYQIGDQTREDLVERLMQMLGEKKVLQGSYVLAVGLRLNTHLESSPLTKDREYVGRVLDAELVSRLPVCGDVAKSPSPSAPSDGPQRRARALCILFPGPFVRQSGSKDAVRDHQQKLLWSVCSAWPSPVAYSLAGPIVSSMVKALENDTSDAWTEDKLWNIINGIVTEFSASRGKVITPLRHALTGRKVRLSPAQLMRH